MITMFLITWKSFKYLHSLEIQKDLTTAHTTQGWPKHWQKSFLYSKSILFSSQLLELTANISFGTTWDFRTEHKRGTFQRHAGKQFGSFQQALKQNSPYSTLVNYQLQQSFYSVWESNGKGTVSSSSCEKELTSSVVWAWTKKGEWTPTPCQPWVTGAGGYS